MKGTPSHDSRPKVKRRGKSFLTVYRKKKQQKKTTTTTCRIFQLLNKMRNYPSLNLTFVDCADQSHENILKKQYYIQSNLLLLFIKTNYYSYYYEPNIPFSTAFGNENAS